MARQGELLRGGEQRRFLRGLEIGLSHGNGQSVPICQVTRGGPPTTPSPGTALPQDPCRVQSNLASPHPRLGLPLKDTTCWLDTSGFQQQSNLWSLAGRPQGKVRESPVQQKNLRVGGTGSSSLRESHRPRAHLPLCMRQVPGATLAPCPNFRPATGFSPLDGCPRPGPRAWRDLESRTGRLVGEPLTLEDLAVPARSQARAPPPIATCLLLASVKRLEQEAAGLRCRVSRKPPGHAPWGPRTRRGQTFPARPQPSQPVHASQDEKRCPRGLLETWGVQAPTDPGALSEPESFTTALGTFTGNFFDSEQEVLPEQPPGQGDKCPPEPPPGWEAMGIPSLTGGTGSSEARLTSSASSSAAGDALLGQEGEQPLREQADREAERTASCPSDATSSRRSGQQREALNGVTLEPQAARWQRLSRCFRAWRHLAWRRWAVTVAVALSRRRLLRKGLQALRWALWLREAQLEAAWGRHTKALLVRSFREWRCLALRQEQGHPHVQSVSRPPCHGLSLGRVAVVDPAQRCRSAGTPSPGRQRQEEGARPRPLQPGQRADDGDGRVQVLQALQHLAVSLLQYHLKDRTRQERAVLEEAPGAPQRTRRMASPPRAWHPSAAGASVTSQPQRAWLPRCSRAWQQLAPRGAQVQNHPADPRLETLRVCLGRWVQMKQLRASGGTKVTRLSLCLKKAGSSSPGATTARGLQIVAQAQGPPQGPGQGSLQEACRRLTLPQALRLWRTRLCQHQQATSFSQGLRERTLRHILSWWRLRAWAQGTLSGGSETSLALGPWGSGPRAEAWLGCSDPQVPWSRTPVLLEPLRVSFLWAAGRRRQRQSLLLWWARAQQSRGAARWCQRSLQRRVLLSWSHWTTAQGARRELAAHRAWERSCRTALGLWRQRLAQWQEAEQRAQERGRGLAREALRCWHSCWQRQQVLHEKYQRWVQGHLRGLRRTMFQGWWQAAARRRHKQRVLKAWAQLAAQGHVQQAAITQLQQAGLRRLLWTHWAQWQMALLRVRLKPWTQAQRMDLEHWPRLASRGCLVLMDTPAPWKQTCSCWTWATGPVLPQPTWEHSHGAERTQKETTWAQSDREHPLCPTSRFWLQWPGQGSWASSWLPSGLRGGGLRALQSQGKAPPRRPGILEEQPQSHGSALLHGHGEVLMLLVIRRKYLRCWRLKARLRRFQASQNARRLAVIWRSWADARRGQQPSQALLRQWHLGQAWRIWRRRVLQLQVAVRLQQQEGGWVLSQAFEKWHQCLVARRQRRGTTSSLSPLTGQAPGP
ncbi:uncharacterized protein C1orf167 homolog [Marmota marmota marmota]|uniref:uncharacterized protein C1orf167 homolog n=1 Tax=Marmota marmota marmota TaxID=9994 RepID=UPI002091EA03|nr:uncharacterized protein C1orf167 homolog [Marmota marmota marmota]